MDSRSINRAKVDVNKYSSNTKRNEIKTRKSDLLASARRARWSVLKQQIKKGVQNSRTPFFKILRYLLTLMYKIFILNVGNKN